MFQQKSVATLDAPSYIDSLTRGATSIEVPKPEDEACSAAPPEAGPPLARERPCLEAVMEYLDGPFAGNFDFMFADEEGGAAGALR